MTFNEYALANEPAIRLSAFFGVFASWPSGKWPHRAAPDSTAAPGAGPPTWAW
jgi:hypothetical protein